MPVTGRVVRVVKGGLIVDVGTTAFLPSSQVDQRRIENFDEWVGQTVECLVLEFVPEKRRIVLSRRKLLDQRDAEKREQLMKKISLGQVIEGTVKRLVEFGAFVDIGGIDGLIPRSEISWHRMAKPADYLKAGDTVPVKVIDIDASNGKITLSRRQMQPDPWNRAAAQFPAGTMIEGEVVSLTNYGAFVRLGEGLDGMIHISDMAWDSGGKQPSAYVAAGQRVQAQVLNVDTANRRISLGLKQLSADPWSELEVKYPPMTRIKGKVTGLTKYGAFVEIESGIEGMVHVSDFSWDQRVNHPREKVNKGDEIEVCILKIDSVQRRISLGVKQLTLSPIMQFSHQHRQGECIEGEIVNVTEFGVFMKLAEGIEGFVHVSQLDTGRVDSPTKTFQIGQSLRAEITKIDLQAGKVNLSRRQLLKREEKQTIASYMGKKAARSGGTNLGELLSELPLDEDFSKS
ncbi:S1 RNA-binding domain-containing protein [Candidatus Sumerlaeota bacterium]|nr:S1 RNA-binding domain-containing protein [Candidatus Sumerlaeota bacterium]